MKPRNVGLVSAIALPLMTGLAFAADVPAPTYRAPPVVAPVFNWTGLYLGANGGYGSAKTTGTAAFTGGFLNGIGGNIGSDTLTGGVAGGQVGVNFQMGAFVVGVEGDWQWSGQQKTTNIGCGVGCALTDNGEINSFGTLRGRFGVAMDRVLIYGTGGAAWTFAKESLTASGLGVNVDVLKISGDRLGWVAGGGVEWAFAGALSIKAEYLYIATNGLTGTGNVPALLGGGTATETVNIRDQVFRAGINYRFGG